MKNIKKAVCVIIFVFFILIAKNVNATSFSFSNSSPKVGDEIKITMSISDVNTATIYADVSGPGINKQITLVNGDLSGDKKTFTSNVSVVPTSTGNISVVVNNSKSRAIRDGVDVDVSGSASITVTEASTTPAAPETPSTPAAPAPSGKSSNANLTNLVVQPVDFTGFRSGKTSGYTVTVGNDVTEVKIIPTLADSKAKYSISGNKDLKEGTNIVKVTVTAEDGTKKTYQVNVIRQVADGEITPNSIEDTTGLEEGAPVGLSKLEIEGYKLSPEFKIDVYEYTLKLEEPKIKTLEEFKALLTMEATFEEAVIEVLGPEEFDLEGENKIIISISDQDGREIAEYKIILDYSPEVIEEVEDEEIIEDGSKIKNFLIDFIKSKIFLVSLDILLFIIALTFIIKYYKQRRILKENGLIPEDEEEYDEYDENIEYRNTETGDDVLEKDVEDKKEEKKNYINELFEGKQTDFDVSEKDYKKRRNKHGKH